MAAAIVAMKAKARRDVISHFMSRDAVSPAQAAPYQPGRRLQRRTFEQFQDAGVLKRGVNGGYYLDVPIWEQYSRKRRTRAGVVIAGSLVIAGAVVAMFG